MNFIFKNICNFFTNQKIFFILLIVSIAVSTLILNFSYGLYQNYNTLKRISHNAENLSEFEIGVNNTNNKYLRRQDLDMALTKLPNSFKKSPCFLVTFPLNINDVFNTSSNVKILALSFIKIENHKILINELSYNSIKNSNDSNTAITEGRQFSINEFYNGSKVINMPNNGVVTAFIENNGKVNFQHINIKDYVKDGQILINNENYNVIGYGFAYPIIPYFSINSDSKVERIAFGFQDNSIITYKDYNNIKKVFESELGDLITMPEPEFPDVENYYFYNTIIIISILISVVSALIIALLYNYILIRRWKSLTIFRLCGCTRMKIIGMYLAECLLISVPIFLLSTVAYDRFLLPLLAKRYENMAGAYSIKLYALIFGIYFVSSIIVLFLMIFKTIPRKAISIKGAGL
ncbi:hypothetical protein FACS1894132_02920 [Clostridia bacterium]|nr:hypothetical protein FACS1894132_02920 [Clostridia bacterium]